MRLRMTKIDEFQLLTCLKHGLWGSKSARFKDWATGDHLAIIVEKAVAALGEVSGRPFVSRERVWDNGVFPHRIGIKFVHAMLPGNRPPVLGEIREALTSAWGPKYGWGILNQNLLSESAASTIVKAIRSRANDLHEIQSKLDSLLEEARLDREVRGKPKKKGRPPDLQRPIQAEDYSGTDFREETSAHLRIQSMLVRMGKATGCTVWVAANDRNREYRGKRLGDECLKHLPNLGLSEEAADRISLIDVIWFRQNAPVCAFEVETTTSVYSGLLRMSDLLSLVPALNMKLFVVAPKERQQKVMGELARPTFQKIGLSEFCKFIPAENLQSLYERIAQLEGHLQPTVIETIALQLEEDFPSALQ